MVVRALPTALSLLLLPLIGPVPPAAADVSAGVEVRLRGEAWDAPSGNPTLEQELTFGLARARARLDGRWDEWSLTAVLQGAAAGGLPERGSFGIGPVYTAADEGDTDPAGAGVAELAVGWRRSGFGITAGRQKASEGFEAPTGVPYLDGVKRARIAERLVGNWDWVNVGRRFDGVAADLATGRLHWAAFAFRPLSGGVDHRDAFEPLDDLEVYGLSATVTGLGGTGLPGFPYPYQELRLGLIRYEDARRGALVAARGEIEVTTLVAHWLAGGPDRDLVLWLALQDGDWGPAEHGAWAVFAEAGRAFPDRPRSPAVRAGVAAASGDGSFLGDDRGDHQTFFNLLPTNHKWYGGMDFSAFSNLETAFVQGSLALPASWRATAELHTFRLAERGGAWWGGSGAFEEETFGYAARRPAGGFRSDHLGEELDLTIARPLPGGFGLTLGGGWFLGGSAAAEVLTEDEDGAWGFAQLTWSR